MAQSFKLQLNVPTPVGLCKAVVQLFLHHCLRQGFQDIPTSLTDTPDIATPFYRHHLRGGVGLQPRGRQLAVLPNGFVDLWVPSSQLDIHTFLPEMLLRMDQYTNAKYEILTTTLESKSWSP